MARPAGYSSDEDSEFDEFGFDDYKPVNRHVPPPPKTLDERLIDAIFAHDPEATDQILNEGANIHFRSSNTGNYTPIMKAASLGYFDVLKVLVNRGANVNDNHEMFNVLMCLCNASQNEEELCLCLDLLLEKGADPLATNWVGATPLVSATRRNRKRMVTKLIERGCPLNGTDGDGWTPIFHAVQNNNVDMVKFLIDIGSNLNIMDRYGNTLWDVASTLNNEELTQLVTPKDHYTLNENEPQENPSLIFMSPYKKLLTMAPKIHDRFAGFHNEAISFLEDIGVDSVALKAKKNNVQFAELMIWDRERWTQLGITMNYQLNKIALHVQKYHEKDWGKGSVPNVNDAIKDDKIDLFVTVQSLFSCLRTTHIGSTSSLYLLSRCQQEPVTSKCRANVEKTLTTLTTIRKQLKDLRKISLEEKRQHFLVPSDLIVSQRPKTKKYFRCKHLIYGSIVCFLVLKFRVLPSNIVNSSLKRCFNVYFCR